MLVHPFHKYRCHFPHSLPFNRTIIHTHFVRKGHSARLASHAGACGPKTAGRETISNGNARASSWCAWTLALYTIRWMIFRCWGGCCTHPASCKWNKLNPEGPMAMKEWWRRMQPTHRKGNSNGFHSIGHLRCDDKIVAGWTTIRRQCPRIIITLLWKQTRTTNTLEWREKKFANTFVLNRNQMHTLYDAVRPLLAK